MRSLNLLTWPQRVNLLRLNERRHTRDPREKRRLTWMLPAYAAAGLAAPGYGVMLAQGLYDAGARDVMVMYACAVSALLALAVSVVHGYAALFGRRDTELVGALPFSQRAVALSRVVPVYLSALLAACLMTLPACAYHAATFGLSAGTAVTMLLILLCTPMLPTAAAVLLSAGIAWVGARFRHKNVLIAALGMLATAGIVVASQLLSLRAMRQGGVRSMVDAVRAPLTAVYPPAAWVEEALSPRGLPALLRFAAVNLVPLALVAHVLGRVFFPLHEAVVAPGRTRRHAGAARPPQGALRALVVKELRGLFGRPMYLMNSCTGLWLTPILLFVLPPAMDMRAALQQPGAALLARRWAPLALSFFLSIASTTSVALSLEGAAAWLMCTCPVPPKAIYGAKLIAFLILAVPTVPASAAAAAWLLPMGAPELLACCLLPAAFCLWMGVAGLRWDLRFRRFTFKSETEMIKQSVQVLLTLGTGFATLLACAGLIHVSGAHAAWASLGCAAALTLLSWLLFRPLAARPLMLVE